MASSGSHNLGNTFIRMPTHCHHCTDFVWGKAFECKDCNFVAHENCSTNIARVCWAANSMVTVSTQKEEDDSIKAQVEKVGQHQFVSETFGLVTYCNLCRKRLQGMRGQQCVVCKYIVHSSCQARAELSCPNLYSTDPSKTETEHAWVEGNIWSGKCIACSKELAWSGGMTGFKCYWCEGAIHSGCMSKLGSTQCRMGFFSDFKLNPAAVSKKHTEDGSVEWEIDPSKVGEGVKPLLVLINRLSGGQQGHEVIRKFYTILNPLQVVDIAEGGPAKGLRMFHPLAIKGNGYRILVCGGDGTVNWVCETLSKFEFPSEQATPPMSLLPLGTGNDLSGVLGWGVQYGGDDLRQILLEIKNGVPLNLDRWQMVITPIDPSKTEDTTPTTSTLSVSLPPTALSASSIPAVSSSPNLATPLASSLPPSSSPPSLSSIDLLYRSSILPEIPPTKPAPSTPPSSSPSPPSTSVLSTSPSSSSLAKEEANASIPAPLPILLPLTPSSSSSPIANVPETPGVTKKQFHHSLSIGVDAKITLGFHNAREAKPENFTSRGFNKLRYFGEGVGAIVGEGCKGLQCAVDTIDINGDVVVPATISSSLESIVISNIPAYADGTNLWGKPKNYAPQQVDDKMIEVVAHKGPVHLVQIKAGVSKVFRLGQGNHIRIKTNKVLPMQIDGEPWEQGPAIIDIYHHSQAKFIVPKKTK